MRLVTIVVLAVMFFQTENAPATCTDWSAQPWSRTTYTSMSSWYALETGPNLTLGVGSIDSPYSRTPYLIALDHPTGFPDGPPVIMPVLGQVVIADHSENICLNGAFAYLSTGLNELAIFDVSNPAAMTVDHTVTLTGGCRDMLLDESRDLLISAEWDSVRIYSTVQPDNPTLLGSLAASQSMALVQSGNLVYVACASMGLRVLDTTNPSAPVQIAHLSVGGTVRDIALWEDCALLVGPTVGLVTVDVSNPGVPVYVSTVWCEGEADQVLTKNGYAYVRAMRIRHPDYGFFEDKLHLFRLPITSPPVFEGSFFNSFESGVMAIAGDNLLLAADDITMVNVQCPSVSSVQDMPGPRLDLSQPWPNPFNPAVEFSFGLPAAHTGRLSVYDLRGQRVRELWVGTGMGKEEMIRWDGTTTNGAVAPSGTYLFVLQDDHNGGRKIRRASLIK